MTWKYRTLGIGELAVEDQDHRLELDRILGQERYHYPKAAYQTVVLPPQPNSSPSSPLAQPSSMCCTELRGIITLHRCVELKQAPESWDAVMQDHDCCFLSVVERYGQSGGIGYGLLQNFGLQNGAVASNVGHDAHNIVLAGTNEADMQLALAEIEQTQGAVVVVREGKVLAKVDLPIAGYSRINAPPKWPRRPALKEAWQQLGCTLPYMGFNLLPLSVIPELRLTDKGLVTVPTAWRSCRWWKLYSLSLR